MSAPAEIETDQQVVRLFVLLGHAAGGVELSGPGLRATYRCQVDGPVGTIEIGRDGKMEAVE